MLSDAGPGGTESYGHVMFFAVRPLQRGGAVPYMGFAGSPDRHDR